jgi:ABC-2 type transport system permease protein
VGEDEHRDQRSRLYGGLMSQVSSYVRVFGMFVRNSLVRDMLFPANFIIETISSFGWMMMNVAFYLLIFQYTDEIRARIPSEQDLPQVVAERYGVDRAAVSEQMIDEYVRAERVAGWDKHQFFVFIATSMLINSIVQMFFMTNADEFSELIRTGGLDFALLKPIDTQFLVSLRRVEWASLANFVVAGVLMAYALPRVQSFPPTLWQLVLYPVYVLAGVCILYSLTIVLAASSVWFGRNTSIYDFWFYITNFSRYPMEIYHGPFGDWLRRVFTFVLPILIVVNVPARMLAKPLRPEYAYLALFAIGATFVSLVASRWVFQRALASYRSASS